MEIFITLLLFVGIIVGLPTIMALLIGLKFTIEDKNCVEEVNAVKRNILWLKISFITMLLIILTAFIYMCILYS